MCITSPELWDGCPTAREFNTGRAYLILATIYCMSHTIRVQAAYGQYGTAGAPGCEWAGMEYKPSHSRPVSLNDRAFSHQILRVVICLSVMR